MSLDPIRQYFRTFGFQLNLWYAGIFTLSGAALFYLVYLMLANAVLQKDLQTLRHQTRDYSRIYRDGGGMALRRWLNERKATGELKSFFVRITTPADQEVFLEASENWIEFDAYRWGSVVLKGRNYLTIPETEERDLLLLNSQLSNGNIILVGKRMDNRETWLQPFRSVFVGAMLPVLLLGFVGGGFLAWRSMKPVRQIRSAVEEIIGTGRLDQRVDLPPTEDELTDLARLFNRMLAKNQRLIGSMRESLDNVAHDLRTPLTRLQMAAETGLQQEPADINKANEALADCMEESDRVLTILATLMSVAEAEAGVMKLSFESVDLHQVLQETIDLYEHIAEEKGIVVRVSSAADAHAMVDPQRVRLVCANLLDNALKYTPSGGTVHASIRFMHPLVVLQMEDNGVGIAKEDLQRIWDRLYRADKSRSQRGLGLGLSLVKAIVEAHGGSVEVSSDPGKGSKFTASFQASDPKS
ncbi:MAG: ATP-binding protein [Verrucomicrobiota bacterium]|nr:ATP-binding protein [Verrucomicrobiota bacterium]